MTSKKYLFSVTAAAACLWPVIAMAQEYGGGSVSDPAYTSHVELGGGWVSTDSFKFGEYSGLDDKGFFGIGGMEVRRSSPWDSGDTEYWEAVGTNLGLDSRSVRVEYGQQGNFSVFLDYDQIPHFRLDDAVTPFIGAGGTDLTLPSNWVGANTTDAMTTLNSNLKSVEIETERKRFGGAFTWQLANEWGLDGTYRHEIKDGLETSYAIFATSGGNPRASAVPLPIDQDTDEVDINLEYSGERLQAQLSYHLSLFRNIDSLIWSNPYNSGSWDPSAEFDGGGRGQLALAPDNEAHQVALSGGFLVDPTTRISGQFSYARMTQDDDFLPFTVNPTLAASITSPLPRSSLDGQIDQYHGNLTLSSRPLPKFDAKARYTFDERDNNTPRDVYVVIRNDSETQAAADSDRARLNRPYSRTKHKLELDAGYSVLQNGKLSAGYDFERIHRDLQEVDDTNEHTARVKFRWAPVSFASGWAQYARSIRRGTDYVSNQPLLDGFSDAHLATLTADELFENDPQLRKFFFADRDRDKVTASVTLLPHELVTLGLSGSHTYEDYRTTAIGLTDRSFSSVTADGSVTPQPNLTLYAFFTYDRLRHEETGYQRTGATFPPGAPRDPGSFWNVTTKDHAYTTGAGVEWAAIADNFDVALDYTFSKATTEYKIDGGSSLTFSPLPELTSRLHALSLHGDYTFRDDMIARLGYRFESFKSRDFAQDGVMPDTIDRVIALGDSSPDYVAHVVGVSLIIGF